jgi:C1q domain
MEIKFSKQLKIVLWPFRFAEITFGCIILILSISEITAQNIGFGTSSPQYRVDVAGRMRLKQTSTEFPTLRFFGPSLQQRIHIGPINDDHLGFYGFGGGGNAFTFNVVNGNIGIGTLTPSFKLDMVGRMRIQQDTSSAGIWFDGITSSVRSFVGTYTNDYAGFYGNGGAGWGLIMNVNDGNFGLGTLAPTRRLDINGVFKLRSSTPEKGKVLTSQDNQGNAFWAKPQAFKVSGTVNSVPFIIDDQVWTKVQFNQNTNYNIGSGYQPTQSEYLIAVKGIYNFKSMITFGETADKHHIRIRMQRNGVTSTINEIHHQGWSYYQYNVANSTQNGIFDTPAFISVYAELLPGDIIWVETFIDLSSQAGLNTTILQTSTKTWFSGKLITRT